MPSTGYSECPHRAHAGTSSALKQRTHTRVRGRRVRMHACASVCTASRYHLAATHHLRRTEQRASNLPPRGLNTAPTVRRAKPHTCVVHEVLTGVCCLQPHGCVARACCALSASPSRASWHDSCRWAARQMLMRTASWHVHVRLARHAECAVRCTAHVIMPCGACSVHGRRTLLSPP